MALYTSFFDMFLKLSLEMNNLVIFRREKLVKSKGELTTEIKCKQTLMSFCVKIRVNTERQFVVLIWRTQFTRRTPLAT